MAHEFPTIPPPPQRLLVFTRLPVLGQVKTRLAATLGDQRALLAHEAMLRDLLAGIGTSSPETEVEILWAPSPAADGAFLRQLFGQRSVAMQTGETLGDRLGMAFSERFFFHRTQKIIAVGVDDPTLTRETVDHAFAILESCEWVIGPARDGGYYLLGCRSAAFRPEVFEAIPWGTAAVFESTIARIREWENSVAVLPLRSDIDVEDDLRRFAAHGGNGELTALIREWGWT